MFLHFMNLTLLSSNDSFSASTILIVSSSILIAFVTIVFYPLALLLAFTILNICKIFESNLNYTNILRLNKSEGFKGFPQTKAVWNWQ